jgi:hypothetical protein
VLYKMAYGTDTVRHDAPQEASVPAGDAGAADLKTEITRLRSELARLEARLEEVG